MLQVPKVAAYVQDNNFSQEVQEQVEIQIKYAGYIEKEKQNADKLNRLEAVKIPKNFDYHSLASLSHEAKEKLSQIMPETISQASRISGINPKRYFRTFSEIRALMFHVEQTHTQLLAQPKDHLVSGEHFEIRLDVNTHVAATHRPNKKKLPDYYASNEYISHGTIKNR